MSNYSIFHELENMKKYFGANYKVYLDGNDGMSAALLPI